jgi:hypothetical protein
MQVINKPEETDLYLLVMKNMLFIMKNRRKGIHRLKNCMLDHVTTYFSSFISTAVATEFHSKCGTARGLNQK